MRVRASVALDEDAVANNPLLSSASERNYEDLPPPPPPPLAYDVDYPSSDHTYGGSNIMYVCTRAPYQRHRRRHRRPPSPPFSRTHPVALVLWPASEPVELIYQSIRRSLRDHTTTIRPSCIRSSSSVSSNTHCLPACTRKLEAALYKLMGLR